ncbi:toll/interleukin-1 receptor domain-containing protein [Frankia sp. R43]|uniref:toll/interleukin-1 receptor domain-containing protein n=1 Tax=Frankia sp. R43 TaxID=269536 RepID=UPI0009F91D52|nr:toll/interleukin-1 receptor domain-containing protein [Frankia sp. R43]
MSNGGNTQSISGSGAGWDFFVSYTQTDQPWAEWIAWTLEDASYRVLIQARDFVPGSNWVRSMDQGAAAARQTIAVLSAAYTRSIYGAAEWQAAWSTDPTGARHKLLIARVEDRPRPGLLGQVVPFDLFGVPQDIAHADLLRAAELAASGGRAKPTTAPPFPPANRQHRHKSCTWHLDRRGAAGVAEGAAHAPRRYCPPADTTSCQTYKKLLSQCDR